MTGAAACGRSNGRAPFSSLSAPARTRLKPSASRTHSTPGAPMLRHVSLAARLLVLAVLLGAFASLLSPVAAEDKPSVEELRAQTALKRLEDRSKESSVDVAKLRQDLAAFRL